MTVPPSRAIHTASLLILLVLGFGLRLAYGMWQPSPNRFWDERYTLDNIRPVYADRSLAPVSGYYPSPVVNAPPAILLWGAEATGRLLGGATDTMDDQGRFSALAYRLMRGLQAIYGVLAIGLLYAIGRRLDTPETGLLAAALFAFTPWQIHSSGYIKPDAQLVASVLLAFLLALRADERPTLGRHAWAGVAVALAASAKLTGVLAAVPLAVATLLQARRSPRRLALAAWAGAVAFATFVLINPYWRGYLQLIGGLRRDYAMRAGWAEMSRWQIPAKLGELIIGPLGLGFLGGTLAVAGTLALAARAASGRGLSRAQRSGALMLLAFPLVYVPVYAVQTSYFKGNNFLPVMALAALFAGWAAVALTRRLAALPGRFGRPAAMLVAVILVAVAAWSGTTYVYRSVIPTTEDLAISFLHRKLGRKLGRITLFVASAGRAPAWEGHKVLGPKQTSMLRIDPTTTLDRDRLAAMDGLVAPPWLFGRPESELAAVLGRTSPNHVLRSAPHLFAARGPHLIAIARRHRPTVDHQQSVEPCAKGEPDLGRTGVTNPGCFRLPAATDPGERWNLILNLPKDAFGDDASPAAALDVGGRQVPLQSVSPTRMVSERFSAPARPATLRLPSSWPLAARESATLLLLRWLPPG